MTSFIFQISHLFYLVISILISSRYVHGYDERYYNCSSTFNCGKLTGIGYPFWGNDQPEYCGHPGFKLDCEDDKITIDIMSSKYLINEINHEAQVLKIARTDFLGNICPQSFVNTTIDFNRFSFTIKDTYATLLYDCDPVENQTPNEFSCPINNMPRDAYFTIPPISSNEQAKGCTISLFMPVLVMSVQSFLNFSITIDQIINEGFEVRWIVDQEQCKHCSSSGGKCGYDLTLKEFSCFCPDLQAYASTCPSPQPAPTNQQDFPANAPAAEHGQGMYKYITLLIFIVSSKISSWLLRG